MRFNSKLMTNVICVHSKAEASRRKSAESIFVVSTLKSLLEAEYFFKTPVNKPGVGVFVDVLSPLSPEQAEMLLKALESGVTLFLGVRDMNDLESLPEPIKAKAQDHALEMDKLNGKDPSEVMDLLFFS